MTKMKKILIVDDQLMYLKSLELALKKQYEVVLAINLEKAINILQVENCDIVLIDIRLDEEDDKNVDGLKILEWLKMNKPNLDNTTIYSKWSCYGINLCLGGIGICPYL
jgi:DNA-binding NtrC family response regulator